MSNQRMIVQINKLKDLFTFNEQQRKMFSETLQNEKVLNEKLSNSNIDLKQRISILRMETDIMGEKMSRLYDALDSLGDSKITEDRYAIIMDQMQLQKKQNLDMVDNIKMEINRLLTEKADELMLIKELQQKTQKLQGDKERLGQIMKERVSQLEKERDDMLAELTLKKDELLTLNKQM